MGQLASILRKFDLNEDKYLKAIDFFDANPRKVDFFVMSTESEQIIQLKHHKITN